MRLALLPIPRALNKHQLRAEPGEFDDHYITVVVVTDLHGLLAEHFHDGEHGEPESVTASARKNLLVAHYSSRRGSVTHNAVSCYAEQTAGARADHRSADPGIQLEDHAPIHAVWI
jgi:hypothetical protein